MATVRIQLRRGTSSQWDTANPTLAAGEIGIETDTNTFKFGDGVTAWNSLDYALSNTVDDYILLSEKGTAGGVATLDGSGKVPYSQIPSIDELSQDAVNTALVAGTGITKTYNDGANTITVAVDTSVIATKAELAEVAQDSVNDSLVAGEGLVKTYDDVNNLITIDIDSTVATLTGTQNLTNKTLTAAVVENGIDINGGINFEGATHDEFETTLIAIDPTADRTISLPDNSGTIALTSNLSAYAPLAGATFTGAVNGTDLTLSGNLTVNGTTTNINTTNLTVEDKNIVLGDTDSPSNATANGGGISLKGDTDKLFTWSLSDSAWSSSENIVIPSDKTYKIDGNIVLSSSQVLGKSLPSGEVVGTNDSQILSNKSIDLTDNTLSGTVAEFNAALSDDNFVTLTGSETLSNKTLTSPVINGPTGLTKYDVSLDNVDNTSDADKPVSTATQSALDLKANLSGGAAFTGTITLPSTTSIGNVSDTEIATLNGVTSAIQTQLDAKLESTTAASTYAPIASPTFTGTVSGVTKSMVGLANVDNTADTDKPISSLTQSALDLKADLAGPTFTGTVTLPGTTSIGDVSSTEIGYVNGVTSSIQTQINTKASSADVSSHTSATTSVHGISDTSQLAYKNAADQTFTGNLEVDGNMTVDGNLTVNGTTFNASATSITIEDNMVQLAHQNSANSVDLGLVVAYNDGSAKHAGIVRDVSDSKWKLFKGVTSEPATTVDFTQGSLDDLALNNLTAAGVVFTDGTQTKEGVPSRTTILQKTASYTLGALTERDNFIEVDSTSATTITIPTNSTLAFPVGTSIDILQTNTGQVTIAGAAGVTVNGTPGLKLRTRWSSATLFKRATDTWVVMGDLTA